MGKGRTTTAKALELSASNHWITRSWRGTVRKCLRCRSGLGQENPAGRRRHIVAGRPQGRAFSPRPGPADRCRRRTAAAHP